jgi:hypothetical protein
LRLPAGSSPMLRSCTCTPQHAHNLVPHYKLS